MEAKAEADQWLAIARLIRPRGRKGELIAEVLTDFPERFATLRRAFVEQPGGEPEPAEVEKAWWHQGRLVLCFAGVESISQAERLRGRLVMVPRGERAALADGRYYLWDLVGCDLFGPSGGEPLGTVTAVEPTGGVDLLRVKRSGADGREVLIPFARAICRHIDVGARRIVIEPPEGLLELNDERRGES